MSVPTWFDGKETANSKLFSDDFEAGKTKLTLKTVAANGVAFKVEGTQASAGAIEGLLETKFTLGNGLTVKDTWSTGNVVTTELSVKNKFVAGSAAKLTSKFSPVKGFESVKVQAEFGKEGFFFDTDFDTKTLNVKSVFGFKSVLVGAKADFDTAFKLNNYTVGGQYAHGDVTVASFVENGNKVRGEITQVVSADLTAGVKFGWSQTGGSPSLEVAGKYKFDADTTIKAKLDNKLALGLAYTQKIKPGVTLNLSAAIDAGNLNAPNHKLGLGLTLEH